MTTLVMASFIAFGLVAYQKLPVSDLPAVDFPTIQVNASLPGASPETMASSVATPLERQFSTIAGITSITSLNTEGNTQITLEFDPLKPAPIVPPNRALTAWRSGAIISVSNVAGYLATRFM